MKMVLVPTPEWADATVVESDEESGGEQARTALEPRMAEILRSVQREIQTYIDDPDLTADSREESFPAREEMAGEYYLDSMTYDVQPDDGRSVMRVSVMAKCLGIDGDDYLGLQVTLYADETGALQLWSIESSAI